MTRIVSGAVGLAVVYALTLASADPVDLVTGAVLGGAVLATLGSRLQPWTEVERPSPASRIAWFPLFAVAVFLDVAKGTWDVTLRVVHLRAVERPGIVRVPIGARSERGVAVTALTTTLSPGSLLIDVDEERQDMLLHVIDASDPDAVRARLQHFYDRYQRRVFP